MSTPQINARLINRRRLAETLASAGMLLIGAGMFLPLLNLLDTAQLYTYRWIFAAGAVMYWAARCIPVGDPGESVRMRRLRRMEFWGGACMGVAAFLWFWNCHKYADSPYVGALMILRDTILFALAGAVIQLVAAWLIYFRQRKEARQEK